ncbi:methyltransferase [environmental halophage 1 AAJ-2005]|nr:methyltransferase [environmental halophage 1 AAJ-2005]
MSPRLSWHSTRHTQPRKPHHRLMREGGENRERSHTVRSKVTLTDTQEAKEATEGVTDGNTGVEVCLLSMLTVVTIPPYRHELRHIVKPLVDAFTGDWSQTGHTRFDAVLTELETGTGEKRWAGQELETQYQSVIEKCREQPGEVTDRELATGLAAATSGTHTDILGAFYQLAGQTSDQFNQYFTPPNVATSVAAIGRITAAEFDVPEPTVENVTGQASFRTFTDGGAEPVVPQDSESDDESPEVVFDPACGSGRLLAAAARTSDTVVGLGWEVERTTARMAAVTMALTGTPGWIVRGDSPTMEANTVWRVTPDADTPLQELSPDDPVFPTETLPAGADRPTVPALGESGASAAECIEEITHVIERGVDLTIANPPFDTTDVSDVDAGDGDRETCSPSRLDVTHRSMDNPDSALRSSQRYEWMMLEHSLNVTRPSGAVCCIVPESLLSNPSQKDARAWMLDSTYLAASIELPEATFCPETHTKTGVIALVPREESEVGLNLDYEIFMAISETMGHNSRATKIPIAGDDGRVSLDTAELSREYAAHQWAGRDEVDLPDDDLHKIVVQYRDHHE